MLDYVRYVKYVKFEHISLGDHLNRLSSSTLLYLTIILDDPDFLVYRRGDLLELHRDRNFSEDDRWIHATNERTSQSGAVSTDAIIILPTVTRPTEDTLVNNDNSNSNSNINCKVNQSITQKMINYL